MNQDILLYTLPQWLIFAGFIAYVYGRVEQKKIFRLVGTVLFFLLGFLHYTPCSLVVFHPFHY